MFFFKLGYLIKHAAILQQKMDIKKGQLSNRSHRLPAQNDGIVLF
jgi:hypothetical protein